MDKALLDFCSTIETLSNTNSINSFVTSKKEAASILPLTLKQQKAIISSQVAGVVGLVRFGRVLNNILLENCKMDNLLVCDKSALAVDLRINAIGDKIRDVPLVEISNRYKRCEANFKLTEVVEDSGITAELAIPTLIDENKIILKLEDVINVNEDSVDINLSNIYTFEVVKYVKSLSIKDVKIEFDLIPSVMDRVKILEKLPLSVNRKIIDYIEFNKLEDQKIMTWGEDIVDISADFFDFE
jgi:hypothetical protein